MIGLELEHEHNGAARPFWCLVCVERRAAELGLKPETIKSIWQRVARQPLKKGGIRSWMQRFSR